MITDDRLAKRNSGLARITDRRGDARVRNGHDDIRFDGKLDRESLPHLVTRFVYRLAKDGRIRTRKIDVLECANRCRLHFKRFLRMNAVGIDDDHLSGFNLTHVFGIDQIERTGLARDAPRIIQLAEHEWPKSPRVT